MENDRISNELKNELDSISKILTMALQCYEFSSHLYSPRTKQEIDLANNSFFIDFTRHIYWRNLIIELAKLVTDSNNQNFNIFKLLRKLTKSGYFGKLDFESIKIKKWQKRLDDEKNIIREIIDLRNKIYSHTDKKKEQYVNSILTFNDIEILIDLLKMIIENIYSDLLDITIELQPLYTINKNSKIFHSSLFA